jgi:hypothetical protein
MLLTMSCLIGTFFVAFLVAGADAADDQGISWWIKTFLAAIAGAAGVLCLQKIREWWSKPVLQGRYRDTEEGCRVPTAEGQNGVEWPALYISIKVSNEGRSTATGCRGFLGGIEVLHDRQLRRTDCAENIPLSWSYGTEKDAKEGINIPTDVPQFLNVFSCRSTAPGFCPATVPGTRRLALKKLFQQPGEYRFRIYLTADGGIVKQICIGVKWQGDWQSIVDDNFNGIKVWVDSRKWDDYDHNKPLSAWWKEPSRMSPLGFTTTIVAPVPFCVVERAE